MTIALEVSALTKSYGAVRALRGVNMTVRTGEVLAVCGDNGAGKSTLVGLLSGAQEPTAGHIALFGKAVKFKSPSDALQQGIATIYQDLAIAPELNVWQNVFMGAEITRSPLPFLRLLNKQAMRARARSLLAGLGQDIADVNCGVSRLSGGQRQAVAIGRALLWNARVVIMDEPTASLGVKEAGEVRGLVRRLGETGVAVMLVSHSMEDVVAVATRVVVLKEGRKVAELETNGLTPAELARTIMGPQQHTV